MHTQTQETSLRKRWNLFSLAVATAILGLLVKRLKAMMVCMIPVVRLILLTDSLAVILTLKAICLFSRNEMKSSELALGYIRSVIPKVGYFSSDLSFFSFFLSFFFFKFPPC
jgi:hypothetical protein